MEWIKQFVIKRVLVDGLDGLLGKLPLNGQKTILGVLVTIAIIASGYLGHDAGTLGAIVEYLVTLLKQLGGVPLLDASSIVALVGLLHKLVKWVKSFLEKREAQKAEGQPT